MLGGSAFNIKSESIVLSNFSSQEVKDLLLQHTQETGQQFTDDALEYVFYLSQGQPWLVNALAYQAQEVGNVRMEMQVLEQIAREEGGHYNKYPPKESDSLELLAHILGISVKELPPTDAQLGLKPKMATNRRGW